MASAKNRSSAGTVSRPSRGDEIESLARLADAAADSVGALLKRFDGKVFAELKVIANDIRKLRREISALRPGIRERQTIPAAGLELDAVVSATESASNAIMECAERVMAADAGDPKRYRAFVEKQMLAIFEACSFQDLTGQRIAKVIETLKQIEARVVRFAAAGPGEAGPARRATGNSQAAIDRIFRSGGKSR
jgi:chemotaxis protein CheZ